MPSALNLQDPVIAQAYKEMLMAQYGGDSAQVEGIYNQVLQQSQGGMNSIQTATGGINQQYQMAGQSLQDRLSAQGLGSSGIGLGALAQLQGQQSTALENAYTSNEQQQLGALQMLLGGWNSASQLNNQKNQQQINALLQGGIGAGQLGVGLAKLLGAGGSGAAASGAAAGVGTAVEDVGFFA